MGRATQNVQYWFKTCFVNWRSWCHQKLFMTCCQGWKDQRRQRTIIATPPLEFTFTAALSIFTVSVWQHRLHFKNKSEIILFFSIARSSRTDVLKPFMPPVSFWLIFLLSFIQHVLFAVSRMYSEYCMLSLQHNKRYTKVGLLGRWRQTTLTILRSPLGTLGQGWGFLPMITVLTNHMK